MANNERVEFVQRCSRISLDRTNCPARGMPGIGEEQCESCGDNLRVLNTFEARQKLRKLDPVYAHLHPTG